LVEIGILRGYINVLIGEIGILLHLIFLAEILLFVDMSQSICLLLLDRKMPPWIIGHGALY